MTDAEYLNNFNCVDLSDLAAGFAYNAEQPTYYTEKLSFMLGEVLVRCAAAEVSLDIEKLPYNILREGLDLVLPSVKFRHHGYEVTIRSDGSIESDAADV